MNSPSSSAKIAPSVDPTEVWFNALFSPITSENETKQYNDAITAFENLVEFYIKTLLQTAPTLCDGVLKCVHIDYVGLVAMLKHFQRDAFGVQKFNDYTESLVESDKLDKNLQPEIIERVCKLGLRVTAEEPRKTRIASTFSLWMCVYRPVSFDSEKLPPPIKPQTLEVFCASLNYWLASTFLEKFGPVILRKLSDFDKRLERIKHDFTCREVSFSTLETLYSSIFRCQRDENI